MGLPILAVLFIAGIVVAASILSGSMHINQTVSPAATLVFGADQTGAKLRINTEKTYDYSCTISDDLTGATAKINVYHVGMSSGAILNNRVTLWFSAATAIQFTLVSVDANNWAATMPINSDGAASGVIVAGTYDTSVNHLQLTYAQVGDFVITLTISGTYV